MHITALAPLSRSGLGLEAQEAAVQKHLNGGTWELLGEFTEVESGRKSERPELAKALALCKKRTATLVIARLDRLAMTGKQIVTGARRDQCAY